MQEALLGFIETALYLEVGKMAIKEGRKDPSALQNAAISRRSKSLFGDEEPDPYERPQFQGCPVTPLSSYEKEIKSIQNFAIGPGSTPESFAQVLMFSPLSANVSFAKHWDNFPVLMTILMNLFPQKIPSLEAIQQAVFSFNEKYSKLGATISGWKFDTIMYIWNNREQLYQDIKQAADSGDDMKLLASLVKIPGAGPVKAGFMAQLIFGRTGCLDTHNIDIYGKVFPDLQAQLNPADWDRTEDGIKRYIAALDQLKQRGIGTKELWDVWVDFVGFMYKKIVEGGKGLYGDLGPALNPNDPKYADLKGHINKMKITAAGKKVHGAVVPVPTITGHSSGGGAGMTHNIAAKHPYDALKQFSSMEKGGPGEDWAQAIRRDIDPKTGMPFNKIMHPTPAMARYFGGAMRGQEVDPEMIKSIAQGRVRGFRDITMSRKEQELQGMLDGMLAANRMFPKHTQKEIATVKRELRRLRSQPMDDESGADL